MGLFSQNQLSQINAIAEKSRAVAEPQKKTASKKSVNAELLRISNDVLKYFKDSPAILISSKAELHDYVDECISAKYVAIDTETTGLDRIKDTIVGASLYYPGGTECYIPIKHMVPIFEVPYSEQLTYEEVQVEFQRLVDAQIFSEWANADFDLAMIFKDIHVDFLPTVFYDALHAWRTIKENEPKNDLKNLYNKYVLKGKGHPMRFKDFFPPSLFPYCKPEIAKLYAANDAKITHELCWWQIPYVTKDNPKCQKHHFEKIADLFWGVEKPMIEVCQKLHRRGIYVDKYAADMLQKKYGPSLEADKHAIQDDIQVLIDKATVNLPKRPFGSIKEFNPNSTPHVQWVVYDLLGLGAGTGARTTDKDVLSTFNNPLVDKILAYRSLQTLVGTFVDKMPKIVGSDHRVHSTFKSQGAATGRMSSSSPNVQNIPSKHSDIRHMFRGQPAHDITLSCKAENNTVSITLFKFSKVKKQIADSQIEMIETCDLQINDFVVLKHNGQDAVLSITDIHRHEDNPDMYTLSFVMNDVEEVV